MSTQHNNDLYEAKLNEAMHELQECQNKRELTSCYECPETIGCVIRTKYVRTVYESMSKGETGGFDF